MRKRLEKPPRFVYSVFGETGEPDAWDSVFGEIRVPRKSWHVISFSEEDRAIKTCNTLNSILRLHLAHYDNWETGGTRVYGYLTEVDKEIKSIEFPGARYSMIRYKYDEAKEKNRLPPGVK